MQVSFSTSEFNELISELNPHLNSFLGMSEKEQTFNLPPQISPGWMYRLRSSSGIEIGIQNLTAKKNLSIIAENTNAVAPLELGICVAGCARGTLHNSSTVIDLHSGQSYLTFAQDAKRMIEYKGQQRFISISISILPDTFKLLTGNISIGQFICPHVCRFSSAMQTPIQQILNCPYQGLIKHLYIESKAIELIALHLEELSPEDENRLQSSALSKETIDQIYHAKEILLSHFHSPPSLMQLARQVGLNDCTLKRGFRQVFGTTAFGCLHQYRMEQAHLLLQGGELSVTKVSEAVGYASLGSFNTAFKKRFGLNPSAIKRNSV